MEKLDMHEVEWIFAMKDDKAKAFYNKYYGAYYEDEPSKSTIVALFRPIIHKTNSWSDIFNVLDLNRTWFEVSQDKKEMTLDEWLYLAINSWCIRTSVHWVDKHAPKDWRKAVDELRESKWYKK